MRITKMLLVMTLAAIIMTSCSKSVEELPKYRKIDLGSMSATHEVITMATFDDIARKGIYGVYEGYDGSKRWGSIEELQQKLMGIAQSEKPIAVVGRFNSNEELGLLDYPITHYNRNCWGNPERSFPVKFFLEYEWEEGSWKEPTFEEKQGWGQFEAVVTGVLMLDMLDVVGAKHACDGAGHLSIWIHVHEVYNKTTGKRVWPPAEDT